MLLLVLAAFVDWVFVIGAVLLLISGALAWFRLPRLGPYVGLVLIAAGVAIFAHKHGTDGARAECAAAEIQTRLDAANADLQESRRAAADAAARTIALDDQSKKSTERVNDLERQLSERAAGRPPEVAPALVNGKCPVPSRSTLDRASDADVRWLRAPSR
ncbi:MAG: hypothetical protein JWM36_4322 [Hyphomicrobiales bacterium]|nr:hypothetical protein [Hyphomicrobiales bacterium]